MTPRAWLPLLTGLTVLVADLASKEWALRALSPVLYGPRVKVLPGLDFMLAYNTGGAFSIFHDRPWLITAGSALITAGIAVWCARFIRRHEPDVPSARLAFGLILGGAVGNLIDRVRFQYVVDFIHAYVRIGDSEYAWPTFNVADMAIVCGIGIFLFLSLFTTKLEPARAESAEKKESETPPEKLDEQVG